MSGTDGVLAGGDGQVVKAVKRLADRAMGAGMRDPDPKAGRALFELFKEAEKVGDRRVVRALVGPGLRDFMLYAAECGEVGVVEGMMREGVGPGDVMAMRMRAINMAAVNGRVEVIEALVRAGEDPSYAGFLGTAVVLQAADKGQWGAVKSLVRLGADVGARDVLGNTVMVLAGASGDAELVRMIVAKGADVDEAGDEGETALMVAARAGKVDVVRELIALGADVNRRTRWRPLEEIDRQGRGGMTQDKVFRKLYVKRKDGLQTALMGASANGHAGVVEELMKAGAEVGLRDGDGKTAGDYAKANGHVTVLRVLGGGTTAAAGEAEVGPRDLMEAAEAGDVRRVREVVAAGVDVNAKVMVRYERVSDNEYKTIGGRPALVIAAERGDLEVVEALLGLGADVEVRGDPTMFENGQNALQAAAERGHLEVVRALVAAGANVKAREQGRKGNPPARTALQLAAENRRRKVVEVLLGAGGKGGAKKSKGSAKKGKGGAGPSGLHEAVRAGDEAMVKRLLDAGARLDKTVRSWTPLMGAGFMGYVRIAEMLLAHGADVNQRNGQGQTALTATIHGARRGPDVTPREKGKRDYAKVVSRLIKAGADVNAEERDETALDMAEEAGMKGLVKIIKAAGGRRGTLRMGGR